MCSVSCQNNGRKTVAVPADNSKDLSHVSVSLSHIVCYATTGKDTVLLKLNISDSSVKGSLIYHLYQKDKNTGTIEGKLYGDTLITNYQFFSEGIKSIRQVAFLIKSQFITEGYGDVEEKNGRIVFKDPKSLDFKNGLILKRVDCDQ